MNKRKKRKKKLNKRQLATQMRTPTEEKKHIPVFSTEAWMRRRKGIRDGLVKRIQKMKNKRKEGIKALFAKKK